MQDLRGLVERNCLLAPHTDSGEFPDDDYLTSDESVYEKAEKASSSVYGIPVDDYEMITRYYLEDLGFDYNDWANGSEEQRKQILIRLAFYRDHGDEESASKASTIVIGLHYRYMMSVVKRFGKSYTPEDFPDLFQEGCMSLIEAWKIYNPEKALFTTYAKFFIQKAVTRYYFKKHGGNVSQDTAYNRIRRTEAALEKERGIDNPSDWQVALESGQTLKTVHAWRNMMQMSQASELDANIPIDEDYSEGKEHLMSPESLAMQRDMVDAVHQAMKRCLDEQEFNVISYKLALGPNRATSESNAEICAKLHITIDEYKRTLARGLYKLRRDPGLVEWYGTDHDDRKRATRSAYTDTVASREILGSILAADGAGEDDVVLDAFKWTPPKEKRKEPEKPINHEMTETETVTKPVEKEKPDMEMKPVETKSKKQTQHTDFANIQKYVATELSRTKNELAEFDAGMEGIQAKAKAIDSVIAGLEALGELGKPETDRYMILQKQYHDEICRLQKVKQQSEWKVPALMNILNNLELIITDGESCVMDTCMA